MLIIMICFELLLEIIQKNIKHGFDFDRILYNFDFQLHILIFFFKKIYNLIGNYNLKFKVLLIMIVFKTLKKGLNGGFTKNIRVGNVASGAILQNFLF